VWGDGTVIDVMKLTDAWRERFAKAAREFMRRSAAHPIYARAEPSPQLMIELSQDFRQRFLHE